MVVAGKSFLVQFIPACVLPLAELSPGCFPGCFSKNQPAFQMSSPMFSAC